MAVTWRGKSLRSLTGAELEEAGKAELWTPGHLGTLAVAEEKYRRQHIGADPRTDTKAVHPLVEEFFKMHLVRRAIREDGKGELYVIEIRKDLRSGEKQRLTYSLDTRENT